MRNDSAGPTRPAAAPPTQPAEHALLGLLYLSGGRAHGYELARQFQAGRPLGDVLRLEPAMLYKHLKKLANRGWVTLALQDQAPRPPRQICRLTTAGEGELRRWLAEPVNRPREIRLEFLVKLYFAWQLDPDLARCVAVGQQAVMETLAAEFARQLAAGAADASSARIGSADFRQSVAALRLEQTRAAILWLERVRQGIVEAVASDTPEEES